MQQIEQHVYLKLIIDDPTDIMKCSVCGRSLIQCERQPMRYRNSRYRSLIPPSWRRYRRQVVFAQGMVSLWRYSSSAYTIDVSH